VSPRQGSPADGARARPQEEGKKPVTVPTHIYDTYSSTECRKHLLEPEFSYFNSKMLEDILHSTTTSFSQCCTAAVTPRLG